MFDSLIVDVAIGLVFTFLVTAVLTSALTETAARFMGLRGDYLLRGVRALVDGVAAKAKDAVPPPASAGDDPPAQPVSVTVLSSPLIAFAGTKHTISDKLHGNLSRRQRWHLPSYIASSTFGAAILDLVVPDENGTTSMASIVTGINTRLPESPLRRSLLSLAKSANGDVTRFRADIERWYDAHMERVSGWYKRHTRWISLAVGAVIVLVFNVNAVSIARDLYTDQALRESVVTTAFKTANCPTGSPSTCIADARKAISDLRGGGLPIGWGEIPACRVRGAHCSFANRYGLSDPAANGFADTEFVLGMIFGWLLTTLALLPGARFWFDILSRLGTLRSSGPKPPPAPAHAAS